MLRERLMSNPRFLEFLDYVRQELTRLQPDTSTREAALLAEKAELEAQCQGWLQSLGNPSLSPSVRSAVETQYEEGEKRTQEIATELAEMQFRSDQAIECVEPERVVDCLQQLDDILASENPSAANLMLSQHIEGIYCNQEGRVVVRTCKLGALAGAIDLVSQDKPEQDSTGGAETESVFSAQPRRRGRLDIGAAIEDDDTAASLNQFAVDPRRFAGLGDEWFSEDVFHLPEKSCWAEEHSREVAEFRLSTHCSIQRTADHFGKTPPTIRKALRYAKLAHDIDATGKGVTHPIRRNWARDNAEAVAEFFQQPGATMKAAAAHFKKSEPTIRKARDLANEQEDQVAPT